MHSYESVIHEAQMKMEQQPRILITIDGPCASGKTTLADKLAGILGAAVVHTDEYVVPHARKTAERLAVPGGNCDWERLVREAIAPWKETGEGVLRRYDCRRDCFFPAERLDNDHAVILEGSYSNLPEIRKYSDIRIFMKTPEAVRMARLARRESPESLVNFRKKWIPLEQAYFTAYELPDRECRII